MNLQDEHSYTYFVGTCDKQGTFWAESEHADKQTAMEQFDLKCNDKTKHYQVVQQIIMHKIIATNSYPWEMK